jgi:hypothetical protein
LKVVAAAAAVVAVVVVVVVVKGKPLSLLTIVTMRVTEGTAHPFGRDAEWPPSRPDACKAVGGCAVLCGPFGDKQCSAGSQTAVLQPTLFTLTYGRTCWEQEAALTM